MVKSENLKTSACGAGRRRRRKIFEIWKEGILTPAGMRHHCDTSRRWSCATYYVYKASKSLIMRMCHFTENTDMYKWQKNSQGLKNKSKCIQRIYAFRESVLMKVCASMNSIVMIHES